MVGPRYVPHCSGMWKMSPKGTYIREWRKHRGLSLERLVQRLEAEPGGDPIVSITSLNRIERGTQPCKLDVLYALAEALDTTPMELMTVNPLVDGKVIDLMAILRKLPDDKIETATRLLEAIA